MSPALARVMIVDDEAPIVRVLKPSLIAAGYEVADAYTGSEALAQAAGWAPDAIVLDLGLPDMDGKEVIQALRKWTQVPIIVLSAREAENERIAALDGGQADAQEFADLRFVVNDQNRRGLAHGVQSKSIEKRE